MWQSVKESVLCKWGSLFRHQKISKKAMTVEPLSLFKLAKMGFMTHEFNFLFA